MLFRAQASLRAVRVVAALLLAIVFVSAPAVAAPKSFGQADAAWHQGELEKAKDMYEQALAAGGLDPTDVVLAHSRVGTVKAALNDTNGALSAFRVAAAIDPDFELPAESGPKALPVWQAHKGKIDLVLTDMVMPERMNGLELAEILWAERPDLKVIFTSGYSHDVVGREFVTRCGANYLQKPYHPEKLARAVRDRLDAGEQSAR